MPARDTKKRGVTPPAADPGTPPQSASPHTLTHTLSKRRRVTADRVAPSSKSMDGPTVDVTVRHTGTGDSCVVGVPEGGTVVELKADALDEMFPGSINAVCEAENVAAHIEGCEEELDDAERVADTGLEDGGVVQLVPRWPNVKAPAVYSSPHGTGVYRITLSRCGTLCAVGYYYGHITVFDTSTAAVVADFTYGNRGIVCTDFSVCGTWLATCSAGTICVWLTSTWEEVCILDHNTVDRRDHVNVSSAAWTHCGRLVSICCGSCIYDNSEVHVWDLQGTPSATVLEGHRDTVQSIAVSGTRIFSGSNDKSIRVWDISTLTHTHTLDAHTGRVTGIALTKDEQRLVSCSYRSLKVWCTTSLSCLRAVQLDDSIYNPHSVAVSQPGDVVAVENSGIALYRLSTGERLGKVRSQCFGLAFSPCGRWVFSTKDGSASVSVWAVSSVSP